ncbi:MAG: hypothetical protein V1493_06400 [Candidatus Diapherotrites archaeon]
MEAKAKVARKNSAKEAKEEGEIDGPKSGSKMLWIAVAVFLVLAAAAVLVFGGFLQPQGGTEQEAIALSDTTPFGKVVGLYGGLFAGAQDCDFEKFVSLAELSIGTTVPAEEKEKMRPHFETAKKCMPLLAKKAEKEADWKFKVTYSFDVPASCDDNELAGMFKSDQLGISGGFVKVDLKEKTAEMPVVPEDALFTSWEQDFTELEASMKEAETAAGADSKAVMDCSIVGYIAMYKYSLASMDELQVLPAE